MMPGDSDERILLLTRRYPQLTEKAVVDLVNGLEVVDDHLRCRSVPRHAFGRLWNVLTGQVAREQYLIDVNMATGLTTLVTWLKDLQAFQAESDLALAIVATRLTETRSMIEHATFEIEQALSAALAEVDSRLDSLMNRVDELESRIRAEAQLDGLMQRWGDVEHRGTSPLLKAFLLIDELWWGAFGRYCRTARDHLAVADLLQRSRRKVAALLAESMMLGIHEILATEEWLEPLSGLPADENMVVAYLAEPRVALPVPLVAAVGRIAGSNDPGQAADPHLPRALSSAGVTTRIFHESGRLTRGLTHGR